MKDTDRYLREKRGDRLAWWKSSALWYVAGMVSTLAYLIFMRWIFGPL